MDIWGLMWFDDTPKRTLADKITPAARRYRQRFGEEPDVVYIHSSMLPPEPLTEVCGLRVAEGIGPPFHFLLVREAAAEPLHGGG